MKKYWKNAKKTGKVREIRQSKKVGTMNCEIVCYLQTLLFIFPQLLKELSEVERHLLLKNPGLAQTYNTSLCLCIVGVVRKYHQFILASQERIHDIFEG